MSMKSSIMHMYCNDVKRCWQRWMKIENPHCISTVTRVQLDQYHDRIILLHMQDTKIYSVTAKSGYVAHVQNYFIVHRSETHFASDCTVMLISTIINYIVLVLTPITQFRAFVARVAQYSTMNCVGLETRRIVTLPKVANVVCTENLFKRKRAKPILQVTVIFLSVGIHRDAYRDRPISQSTYCGKMIS